jgi:hypothetical protein
MAKRVRCPICGKICLAEIDEKGNLVYYGKDDNYHKCKGSVANRLGNIESGENE